MAKTSYTISSITAPLTSFNTGRSLPF
jgi:hypothetical protein